MGCVGYTMWPFGSQDGKSEESQEPETMTLRKYKWTETVEETVTMVEDKLVWSGGAEKVIEHCPKYRDGFDRHFYYDENNTVIFEVNEEPVYHEVLDSWEETIKYNKTRTAWINGSIPNGVSETDRTKEVEVLD